MVGLITLEFGPEPCIGPFDWLLEKNDGALGMKLEGFGKLGNPLGKNFLIASPLPDNERLFNGPKASCKTDLDSGNRPPEFLTVVERHGLGGLSSGDGG